MLVRGRFATCVFGLQCVLQPPIFKHFIISPPPPPKKSDIQFQGIEASESKSPLGDPLIGQNNDFTRGWTSSIMPLGMLRE